MAWSGTKSPPCRSREGPPDGVANIEQYKGREQAWVKHQFLESYLEALLFKVGSFSNDIVYVDGFAGPWKSVGEKFEDTSFGRALQKIATARAKLAERGRNVRIRAILVEADPEAYERLKTATAMYPAEDVVTLSGRFLDKRDEIKALLGSAFAFFFVDPLGWKVDLATLGELLRHPNSEVVYNFMFDFANRFLGHTPVENSFDELFVGQDWRSALEAADPTVRKEAVLAAFTGALASVGRYKFCLAAEVSQVERDRPLYALVYGTRHWAGLYAFRDAQVRALKEQAVIRQAVRQGRDSERTGQVSLFGPEVVAEVQSAAFLKRERDAARESLQSLAPASPTMVQFRTLAERVMVKHIVRHTDVRQLAGELRREGLLIFPRWPVDARKRVPEDDYPVCRPVAV